MSRRLDPILTQFGVSPSTGVGAPFLEVDRSTGLLYEPGASAPFVENLFEIASAWQSLAETVLTKTSNPLDPDLVRGDPAWYRFSEAASTSFTKADLDPEDPDLLRSEQLEWLTAGADSPLTRHADDPSDPDLIRMDNARERPPSDA